MTGFNLLIAVGEGAKSLSAHSPTALNDFFFLELGEQNLF